MIRFTKHNGMWALTGLEAELNPNTTVTVTKSGGVSERVLVGALLTPADANGMVVAALQKPPRLNSQYRQYRPLVRDRYASGSNEPTALNQVLALLSQAEALVKQAALMDPAPADQERKFFADLTDAMKDFKKSRAVKAAQSA